MKKESKYDTFEEKKTKDDYYSLSKCHL